MLLCTPASCGIDRSQREHAATPYVIFEFLRQLGQEACNLLQYIFNEQRNLPMQSRVIRRLLPETSARLLLTWDLSTPVSSLLSRRRAIGLVRYATLST